MRIIAPYVAKTTQGFFKVIIWGQHDDHMMDWRGCNYRYIVVKGQPRKGFLSEEFAKAYWDGQGAEFQDEEIERASWSVGTHLPDFSGPEFVGRGLEIKSKLSNKEG